jgi:hypothetical protein
MELSKNSATCALMCLFLASTAYGQSGTSTMPAEKVVQLAADSTYDTAKHLLSDARLKFHMEWPDQPTVNDRKIKTEFGEVSVRVYAYSKGEATFMVMHSEYPDKFFALRGVHPVEKPVEFLDFAGESGLATKKESKLLLRKKIELGEYLGMEQGFSFPAGVANGETYPEGIVFQRAYLRGKSMDMLMVQLSKELYQADSNESKKMMLKFLESFQYDN